MHHDCKRKNKNTRAKGGKEGAWCLSLQLFPGSENWPHRVLQICLSGARRALLKGLFFWFFLDQVSSSLFSFPDMPTIISVYILGEVSSTLWVKLRRWWPRAFFLCLFWVFAGTPTQEFYLHSFFCGVSFCFLFLYFILSLQSHRYTSALCCSSWGKNQACMSSSLCVRERKSSYGEFHYQAWILTILRFAAGLFRCFVGFFFLCNLVDRVHLHYVVAAGKNTQACMSSPSL